MRDYVYTRFQSAVAWRGDRSGYIVCARLGASSKRGSAASDAAQVSGF
jgi:hypothetical protein